MVFDGVVGAALEVLGDVGPPGGQTSKRVGDRQQMERVTVRARTRVFQWRAEEAAVGSGGIAAAACI